jgi:Cu(I)/Ag(I) efflux system protein CusF
MDQGASPNKGQNAQKDGAREPSTSAQAEGGLYSAEGEVVEIFPDKPGLTLDHDPIPALNWPRMTMGFLVESPDLLEDLAVGDRIDFDFKRSGDSYLIVDLEKK